MPESKPASTIVYAGSRRQSSSRNFDYVLVSLRLRGKNCRFAQDIELITCRTAVRSPQSNGMAEAFVDAFKRDYVDVQPKPDAQSVLRGIGAWFDDYNENHPHKALKWRSQREFRQQQRS